MRADSPLQIARSASFFFITTSLAFCGFQVIINENLPGISVRVKRPPKVFPSVLRIRIRDRSTLRHDVQMRQTLMHSD